MMNTRMEMPCCAGRSGDTQGRDLIQSEKRKESTKEGFLEEEAAKLNFAR